MISKEELDKMYWIQSMSMREIAKEVGVCLSTVRTWMKNYNIESRTDSESLLIGSQKPSKEGLEEMYCGQGMSQYEIASEIGVNQMTVNKWLKSYGIRTRTKSESQLNGIQKLSKKELGKMYCDQGMSQPKIAIEIGVTQNSVHNWMKEYEILSRTRSEARINGNFIGERNSNWHGGISFEPYCNKFNNVFKESVRKRDDYTCQLCGYEQLLDGKRLDVHHIHYDKENCAPDVVALCRSCNSRVNGNRDYWEQYFEEQLLHRGIKL